MTVFPRPGSPASRAKAEAQVRLQGVLSGAGVGCAVVLFALHSIQTLFLEMALPDVNHGSLEALVMRMSVGTMLVDNYEDCWHLRQQCLMMSGPWLLCVVVLTNRYGEATQRS